MPRKHSRRSFLSRAALAAGGVWSCPALRVGAGPPGGRIRVGVMGTSRNSIGGDGRGTHLAMQFAQRENTEVAYVCDVDSRNVGLAIDAVAKYQPQPPQGVGDFRRILDDDGVDVLVIAAPDHWHGPAAILGCAAGKHVYVEKPCCHNPAEGELMLAAAAKNNRHVQVGTQRRSWPALREAMERLRSGALGEVRSATCYYYNDRQSIGRGQSASIPEWLDWELWQGPAPRIDYRDNIVHYNWHWFWHWGTAELGNNGVHTIDVCRWGLGVDVPASVICTGNRDALDDDRDTPTETDVTFGFAGGKSIRWRGFSCRRRTPADPAEEIRFHGTTRDLTISGGGYAILEGDRVVEKKSGNGGDADHIQNLLDTIRGEGTLNCPISEGVASTRLCHLGNISYRLGKPLGACDALTGRYQPPPVGSDLAPKPEVERLWSRDYAPGWTPPV